MTQRSKRGNLIVETPLALFVFLFLFCFPLLDLATVTLRTTFLYAAAHNAAWESARAHTYLNSLDGQPSAVQLASSSAFRTAAAFGGIQVNSVKTNIVATNINSLNQTKQTNPLALPADQSLNSYQVEVSVNGAVNPLIIYNAGGFTNIPGLTQPMILTFTDRQYCENPQGLNK
jgi:Flp pilus assembly protein TadG